MSKPRTPVAVRLLRRREIDPETGCWNWTGHIHYTGYGQIRLPDGPRTESTHRASYMEFVGPIPEGLHLDHLCRNTACFNPEHLEPVTAAENTRRARMLQTHCKNGHELTPENIFPSAAAQGLRKCRICQSERSRAYRRSLGIGPAHQGPWDACGRGHSMRDGDPNLRLVNGNPDRRVCRECERIHKAAWRARRAEVARAA